MVETIRLNTAVMRAAVERESAPEAKLRALIHAELESINGRTGEAMAVLVYEWRSLSESSQEEVLALREVYESLWLSVLQQLKDGGQLSSDVFIARRMLTGALSWTVTWYRPERGGLTLDGLTDEVMAMLGF